MMKNLALLALCFTCLASCSQRELYNSAAGARQQECTRMMDRDQYERCMKQADRSYDEYDRGRKP